MTLFSARPAARSNNKAVRLLFIALLSVAATAKSEPLSIAVASNFRFTLEALLSEGIKAEPATYRISAAASGLLYAQIVNGARFHLFFSADEARPKRLMQDALIVSAQGKRTPWVNSLFGCLIEQRIGRSPSPISRALWP